jgi:enoyl-CoA hydratase/carnithine racemase
MTQNIKTPATDTEPYLLKEMSGAVLWLTMNRPKTRNPLSLAMIAALQEAIVEADTNPEVSVVVIASSGPVFCTGHDLHEMGRHNRSEDQEKAQRQILTNCTEMMLTIMRSARPVIACIQGTATAGGCQLVSTCDLAIAADTAQFCTPGVNIGGFCTTPLVGISRKMHRKHAMELALTGDMFCADDAFRFGIVNRVVPADKLREETETFAQNIATKSSMGIRHGKSAFYEQIDMPIEEAYAFAIEKMIEGGATSDAAEGTRAFFEKRKPRFTDD